MPDDLMTKEEVAKLLGVKPRSVNNLMARHGITWQRPPAGGYDRAKVQELIESGYGRGQGRRTDLNQP